MVSDPDRAGLAGAPAGLPSAAGAARPRLYLARTLGLLLWGYLFWLLAMLGVLRNDPGGILLALGILVALSGLALRGGAAAELADWLRQRGRLILGVEALFLAAFALMLVVRAANPEILGTEKPMELGFINAILHSPVFPPHDPWLSGYAISYYYFGYVLVAMLAMLTGTAGGVAFNLGISLVFALSALGVYGLVYNLLAARRPAAGPAPGKGFSWLALLGPAFILVVSNLVGFLEMLHARGLFWSRGADGVLASPLWRWLDLRELSQAPAEPFGWLPTRYLWWWRASRVVQDYDFAGNWKEVIDEFPVFSYILADLHPHVLAMPFAFLAISLALNLFLGGGQGRLGWLQRTINVGFLAWSALTGLLLGILLVWAGAPEMNLRILLPGVGLILLAGMIYVLIPEPARRSGWRMLTRSDVGELEIGGTLAVSPAAFLLAAVVFGGTAFLNIWDFPFFVALFAGAYAVRQLKIGSPVFGRLLGDFFAMSVSLLLAGLLAYLPFYLGFQSQAGGILPNIIYPTRGAHLWVMFAPQLLVILAFLWYLAVSRASGFAANRRKMVTGLLAALGFTLFLWVLSLLMGAVIAGLPGGLGDLFLSSVAAPGLSALLAEAVVRRFANAGGWITLVILMGLALGLLFSYRYPDANEETAAGETSARQPAAPLPVEIFVLLVILLGALLVLGPEFFYLRDLFGWRINTIFKFYYQAWHLWGVAAAFGAALMLRALRGNRGALYAIGLVLVLAVSFTYTFLGVWTKTNGFKPAAGWTLDGTAYLDREQPDEMLAVRWLSSAPPGVVAEAVGGSYSSYARVSALSGQPAVLGWDFHEMQWRGSAREIGSRGPDIQRLYCTRDEFEAQEIMRQYGIRYVYIGLLERSTYTPEVCPGGLSEAKFMRFLSPVFQQGTVVIYAEQ